MKIKHTFIASLLAVLLLPALLFAADSKKAELQKRFKERYPEIQRLKEQGVIGETDEGYVDFVAKKDSGAADTVNQENADRRALYELIAKNEGTSIDTVAKHNAQRNFEKAKAGEYLRYDGKWRKKT